MSTDGSKEAPKTMRHLTTKNSQLWANAVVLPGTETNTNDISMDKSFKSNIPHVNQRPKVMTHGTYLKVPNKLKYSKTKQK